MADRQEFTQSDIDQILDAVNSKHDNREQTLLKAALAVAIDAANRPLDDNSNSGNGNVALAVVHNNIAEALVPGPNPATPESTAGKVGGIPTLFVH